MKEQLSLLLTLQQIDSEIDRLKQNYASLDPGRAEGAAYAAAKSAHEQARDLLAKTRTDIQDAELEQKSLQAKHEDVEKKLYSGKVTAPKEMMAMQEEIEMFKRQRERLDDRLLELMTAQETQAQAEAETKQARTAAATAYKAKQEEYKSEAEGMQAEAKILAAKRKEAVIPIEAALLTRYTQWRDTKGGVVIAPIIDNNACGGCHMGLPGNIILKVHEGRDIVTCQNCRRILCEAPKEQKTE
jgi:uncharacterized protein